MKFLRPLLLGLAVAGSFQSRAQQGSWVSDSISMGGGYPMDVFYSFKNGVQKADSNRNWHLAFQMTSFPNTDVSILANFAGAGVKVWSMNKQGSTHFTSLSAADTMGKTSEDRALYNGPRSWNFGALNRTRNTGSLFDYGWGTYNTSSHDVDGDSLFLLKIGASTYKLWVQNYEAGPPFDSIRYTFRIASWNNSIDRTVTIRRSAGFSARNFAYYDVANNLVREHEPAQTSWDMVFTRYGDTAYAGPIAAVYPVTGVLSNTSTEVAKVTTIQPDTNAFAAQTYSKRTDMIGDDWKYTVGSGQGTTFALDTVSYFIKSGTTNEYYLLRFTHFGGTATGKTVFAKKLLGTFTPASVVATATVVEPTFMLAPNPTTDRTQLMLDAAEATAAQIVLTDVSGRVAQRYSVQLQKGMNGFGISTANIPAGVYFVTATNGSWKTSAKLVVQH